MKDFQWKDVSCYRQTDKVREPCSFELRVGSTKVVVTRHIHHAPDAWVLNSPPFFNDFEVGHGTADEAKSAALEAVRAKLNEVLVALGSKGSFEMSEQEQAGLVRYCPECGCIGEVTKGCRDCCPDGSHHFYVPDEIARQARAGFLASIYPQPREADILRSHGYWCDAHNCYGHTAGDMARHHAGIVEALAASSAPTAPAQGQEADRKDAERLDWLEWNFVLFVFGHCGIPVGRNIRESIDAAMAASKEGREMSDIFDVEEDRGRGLEASDYDGPDRPTKQDEIKSLRAQLAEANKARANDALQMGGLISRLRADHDIVREALQRLMKCKHGEFCDDYPLAYKNAVAALAASKEGGA